jgi:hypothetical protein
MPIVSDKIGPSGAVIDILLEVSHPRRRLLERSGVAIPPAVHVRALIDTGANISGFTPRVFTELDVTPVDKIAVMTPSTSPDSPHQANLYDVSLSVVAGGRANPIADFRVMEADCWLAGEGVEALIGRDILERCFFQYRGPDRAFTLAF